MTKGAKIGRSYALISHRLFTVKYQPEKHQNNKQLRNQTHIFIKNKSVYGNKRSRRKRGKDQRHRGDHNIKPIVTYQENSHTYSTFVSKIIV